MPTQPMAACQIASTAIGMTILAVGSGVTGGTLTLPAMLLGGAAGYLLGRVVCRIPSVEKTFERALGSGNWAGFEEELSKSDVRAEVVGVIAQEVGISENRASEAFDGLVHAWRSNFPAIGLSEPFRAAAHHPPYGTTGHGLALLRIKAEVIA